MPTLRELQTRFSQAVWAEGTASQALLAMAGGDSAQAARGLASYRASVVANLAATVRATFPVVGAIVGDDYMLALAQQYARSEPSRSGDLNRFGQGFAAFVQNHAVSQTLPYLADVATLEWAVLQCYSAADAPPLDLSALSATDPARWGELHAVCAPAHALLASRWPLARIWEVNQSGYSGDFAVDFDQAQWLMVLQTAQGTQVEAIAQADYLLLQGLARQQSLADALAPLDTLPDLGHWDLQTSLQRFIGCGLLRSFYLPT